VPTTITPELLIWSNRLAVPVSAGALSAGALALGLGLWDVLLLQPLIMPSIPTMTEAQRSKDSVFLAFMMFPPVLIDFSLL